MAIIWLFLAVLVYECVCQRVPRLGARLPPIFMGLPLGFAQIRSVVPLLLPGSDCAKLDR